MRVPLLQKLLKVPVSVMLFPADPGVVAVTVTVVPLAVAVTPTPALLRMMAAARLVAASLLLPSSAKFVPVFTALTPPLSVPVLGDKVILTPPVVVKAMVLPAAP